MNTALQGVGLSRSVVTSTDVLTWLVKVAAACGSRVDNTVTCATLPEVGRLPEGLSAAHLLQQS